MLPLINQCEKCQKKKMKCIMNQCEECLKDSGKYIMNQCEVCQIKTDNLQEHLQLNPICQEWIQMGKVKIEARHSQRQPIDNFHGVYSDVRTYSLMDYYDNNHLDTDSFLAVLDYENRKVNRILKKYFPKDLVNEVKKYYFRDFIYRVLKDLSEKESQLRFGKSRYHESMQLYRLEQLIYHIKTDENYKKYLNLKVIKKLIPNLNL